MRRLKKDGWTIVQCRIILIIVFVIFFEFVVYMITSDGWEFIN